MLGWVKLSLAWRSEESLTVSRQVDDPWCLSSCNWPISPHRCSIKRNYTQAKPLVEEVMALGRKQGLQYPMAMASMQPGFCAWQAGDYDAARTYLEESSARHQQFGDRRQWASVLYCLGAGLHWSKATRRGQQTTIPKVLRWRRRSATKRLIASLHRRAGNLALRQGDPEMAAAYYAESLTLAQEVDDRRLVASLRCNLGNLALRQGDPEMAAGHFAESFVLAQTHQFKDRIAICLLGLAEVACARRQPERAAQLLAAAARVRDSIGMQLGPLDGAEQDRIMSATQAQLDQALFTMA